MVSCSEIMASCSEIMASCGEIMASHAMASFRTGFSSDMFLVGMLLIPTALHAIKSQVHFY